MHKMNVVSIADESYTSQIKQRKLCLLAK